jgi:DNA-binding transcriptional LysR family regulator
MPKILDWDVHIGKRVPFRALHILLTVVQCGSMAKAAEKLGVSQPAVSEAIADLEQVLNVRLLDRGRRGVEPTVHGATLLKSGRAAFDELRQGIKQIESLSGITAGELRIASPESISCGILGPIVKLMSERYPRVQLSVEPFLTSARPLYPQLDRREVDLVLVRSTPREHNDLAVEILFQDQIRLAAASDGPWARRRKIELAELIDEPWITVPSGDVGSYVIADAFRARGLEPPKIAVRTYSIHLRNNLAAGGRFISVLPKSVLYFGGQNLCELPIDLPTPPWPVAIITAKGRTPNPVTARFLECAREVAKSISTLTRSRKS